MCDLRKAVSEFIDAYQEGSDESKIKCKVELMRTILEQPQQEPSAYGVFVNDNHSCEAAFDIERLATEYKRAEDDNYNTRTIKPLYKTICTDKNTSVGEPEYIKYLVKSKTNRGDEIVSFKSQAEAIMSRGKHKEIIELIPNNKPQNVRRLDRDEENILIMDTMLSKQNNQDALRILIRKIQDLCDTPKERNG